MQSEGWKFAVSMIPGITSGDVDAALGAADRKLGKRKRADLCSRLTVALHNYVLDHLIMGERVTPSKLRPLLKQVIKGTDALCATKGIRPILATTAANLRDLARHELAMQEARIALKSRQLNSTKLRAGRHEGNKPLRQFFGELNGVWIDCFNELPGVTWDAHRAHGGAYVEFSKSILRSYAAKIPNELERLDPGLRARLRMSPQAIHGYFRRTGISKVRRIAKSRSRLS